MTYKKAVEEARRRNQAREGVEGNSISSHVVAKDTRGLVGIHDCGNGVYKYTNNCILAGDPFIGEVVPSDLEEDLWDVMDTDWSNW